MDQRSHVAVKSFVKLAPHGLGLGQRSGALYRESYDACRRREGEGEISKREGTCERRDDGTGCMCEKRQGVRGEGTCVRRGKG